MSTVKKRYHFAYFAVMLVKLQRCPGIGETRLQCPKFVVRVSSLATRSMNLGAALSPIGQGNLFFFEELLVFRTKRLDRRLVLHFFPPSKRPQGLTCFSTPTALSVL